MPWEVPAEPGEKEALVAGQTLLAGGKVVLEEFSFEPRDDPVVLEIAQWLANNALPAGDEHSTGRRFCLSTL